MTEKNYTLFQRFGFAFSGIKEAFCHEQNFRIQSLAACGVSLSLLILRPGVVWWALCSLCVSLVLAAEMFNTALERVLDGLHPERADFVRQAKDCAAGAVLVLSFGAVAVFVSMLFSVLG